MFKWIFCSCEKILKIYIKINPTRTPLATNNLNAILFYMKHVARKQLLQIKCPIKNKNIGNHKSWEN